MTLCPIALAVGCKKCPAFGICPLKNTLGDQTAAQTPPARKSGDKANPRPKK